MSEKHQSYYMNCAAANGQDLVGYLAQLGFMAARVRGAEYWYLSPLRSEGTPSFKVNRKLNRWYDFGEARGGSLIDFGIRYFNCTVSDFLQQLVGMDPGIPMPTVARHLGAELSQEQKLTVTDHKPLRSQVLLDYLVQRKINPLVASRYCSELNFTVNKHRYFGVGFLNQSGGWEIRNSFQKYAASPKDFSLIVNGAKQLSVFEGFIDLLSYLSVLNSLDHPKADYLVLNGIGLFERARVVMETYPRRGLFLDQDQPGRTKTAYGLALDKGYRDESGFYKTFKDVNDWLVKTNGANRNSRGRTKGLTPKL